MLKYLDQFDATQCDGHERRYALSAEWIEPLLVPGAVVYDYGRGDYPFAAMIRQSFPAVDLRTTGDADLRYPLPIESDSADGVCCMEVLEHMKDRSEDDPATFTYSGLRNLLAECLRILKPGGWLFLTTPNVSSYGCLWSHLKGESPQWYLPHVRELGFAETKRFLTEAGFHVDRFDGVDVWPATECPSDLVELVERLCPMMPRENCLFTLSHKPQ